MTQWIVLRADAPEADWTGASVIEAKDAKEAVKTVAGSSPGHYGEPELIPA